MLSPAKFLVSVTTVDFCTFRTASISISISIFISIYISVYLYLYYLSPSLTYVMLSPANFLVSVTTVDFCTFRTASNASCRNAACDLNGREGREEVMIKRIE